VLFHTRKGKKEGRSKKGVFGEKTTSSLINLKFPHKKKLSPTGDVGRVQGSYFQGEGNREEVHGGGLEEKIIPPRAD